MFSIIIPSYKNIEVYSHCFKRTFLGWMLNSRAISYLLGYIKI